MLDRVRRCWMSFDFCQTFHPTSANIFFEHAHLAHSLVPNLPAYVKARAMWSQKAQLSYKEPPFCLKSEFCLEGDRVLTRKDIIFNSWIIFYQHDVVEYSVSSYYVQFKKTKYYFSRTYSRITLIELHVIFKSWHKNPSVWNNYS